MFLFAVAHGARASEIANLRISDINFKTEQIHIARLKGSLESTQNLLRVKSNALFNEAAVLKAWLDVREADADNFVFNSQKSTRLNRVAVFKLFKAIARKAELGETLQHSKAHCRDAHGPAGCKCFPDPSAPRAPLIR
jgi:integrase